MFVPALLRLSFRRWTTSAVLGRTGKWSVFACGLETQRRSVPFFTTVISKEKLKRCAATAPWSYVNVSNNVKVFF